MLRRDNKVHEFEISDISTCIKGRKVLEFLQKNNKYCLETLMSYLCFFKAIAELFFRDRDLAEILCDSLLHKATSHDAYKRARENIAQYRQ